jgi:phosphoenolpyruvate carboxykinase (ATP)
MDVPQSCPDVPDEVLNPRNTWSDKAAYDKTAQALAGMFEKNFVEFEPQVDDGIKKAAIRPAA